MMGEHSRITISNIVNESKMVVNGGVQIPADGWYQIELDAEFGVDVNQASLTDIYQCTGVTWTYENGYERQFGDVTIDYSLEKMPVEIQILKYNTSDGSVDNMTHELIHKGDYPNEAPWYDFLGTGIIDESGRRAMRGSTPYSLYTNITSSTEGQSVTTVVDHYVNPDFICGLSQSNASRSVAYIKDGYSWNSEDMTEVQALYNCNGYYLKNNTTTSTNYIQTTVNQNSLLGATSTSCVASSTARHSRGNCKIIMKLVKGDMIVPFIQCRGYYKESPSSRADTSSMVAKPYLIDANGTFKIKAVAPWNVSRSKLSYNMDSLFDKELNLGNFNNNQQKISDFFNDVQKAFNLSFQQDGNNIILNKNKIQSKLTAPVEIDNKVNTSDAVFAAIDFPSSIQVKWNIDTEEEGFYRSVEANTTEEQMQSNNWKDYGDYGYQKVNISQADDAKELSESLNFSYNWYQPFRVLDFATYMETIDEIPTTENYSTVQLPVIGKTEWWIEGYDYEGMASNDGRGFRQRFWFRGEQLTDEKYKLPVNDKFDKTDDWYNITLTKNYKQYDSEIVYLNYNNGVDTLLGKYFNIDINSASDEVEVEVYLTPMEYKLISQGASVHFDDDIYIVNEVNGYDPTGTNPTKLILMKK